MPPPWPKTYHSHESRRSNSRIIICSVLAEKVQDVVCRRKLLCFLVTWPQLTNQLQAAGSHQVTAVRQQLQMNSEVNMSVLLSINPLRIWLLTLTQASATEWDLDGVKNDIYRWKRLELDNPAVVFILIKKSIFSYKILYRRYKQTKTKNIKPEWLLMF